MTPYMRADCQKNLFIVEEATRYDLYDQPGPVAQAVERLLSFHRKHL
ncbi:hypothetical protein [Cupriavidus consociatus]|nr:MULTISPECIES: hypothetical protein [unclassified Cupriavidus]MBP0620841.1 hypothetical protein [Cupriavidus sp. LEh25]MDK2657503.1 hypothetical protein [Cupriavidus sp. LEh21]